jgi:hypothetical protein
LEQLFHQPRSAKRHARRIDWLLTGGALIVAAVLACAGLDNDLFWDDEANTALFARNLLATGELTAWDGNNLVSYRHGAELDENLINVYMPRGQYYLAALGFALFGEGTLAGRVPFVVVGLLGIVALALLARNLLGGGPARHLPALLIAVSPAYLLFIRNCRYYALGALFAVSLLAAFTSRLDDRRRVIAATATALLSTAGLLLTNYLYAAGALAAVPVLLLLEQLRTRRRLALLGAIYGAAALLAVWIYATMSPLESEVIRSDSTPAVERLFTLLGWNLTGLGTFEFLPLAILPGLLLPFYVERLRELRPFARRALVLAAATGLWLVTTVAFSPQSVSGSMVADMRYLVPLIPLGAVLTAAALSIIWRLWRPAALALGLLVVFTNIPHLAFLGDENGFLPPKKTQCTICRYVAEQAADRTTATEGLIAHLRELPDENELLIVPAYMAYPAMYYLPHKRFCCQIYERHPLREDLRAALPDRVFWERATPNLGLINRLPPSEPTGPLYLGRLLLGHYRISGALDLPEKDFSRPEIPWHAFDADEVAQMRYPRFLVVELRHDR